MKGCWVLVLSLLILSGCSNRKSTSREAPTSGDAADVVCLGTADVEGGVAELRPERPGRVIKVYVVEGAKVKENEELLCLDNEEALQEVARALAVVKAAQGRETQARQEAKQHPLRVQQMKSTLEATISRLAGARVSLKRQEELFQRNLVSKGEVDVARELVHELEASVEAARARQRELDAIDPQVAVSVAAADLEAARAQLKRAETLLDRCVLRAPSAGTVVVLSARAGEVVGAPGMPAPLLFQPEQPFVVRAEIEQELVARLEPGMLAMVRDEIAGLGPWKGEVVRISGLYARRKHRTDPTQFVDVPTVECLVRLHSGHPPLRIGQRLRVSIYSRPQS